MRGPRLGCLTVVLGSGAFIGLVIAGVMNGSVFETSLTPAANATSPASASQCESLPAPPAASASPSASASPAATAAAGQLCLSVQADQTSIKPGQTSTWVVQVWAQGGSAPDVTVGLTTTPAGLGASFASACPTGDGSSSCTLGDMGTALTPSFYVLHAQLKVPASSTGTVTLVAAADAATTPAMATDPAAGLEISVTRSASSASPSSTHTSTAPASTGASPHAVDPSAATSSVPVLGGAPIAAPASSTVPAGNVASVLPIISPDDVVVSTPAAANIADVAGSTSSAPQAGRFTLSIGMSAQTAEILGLVLFGLTLVLMATRSVGTYLTRNRQPAVRIITPAPSHHRRPRGPRFRFPHRRSRVAQAGTARLAEQEQAWQRHVESERLALPPGDAAE